MIGLFDPEIESMLPAADLPDDGGGGVLYATTLTPSNAVAFYAGIERIVAHAAPLGLTLKSIIVNPQTGLASVRLSGACPSGQLAHLGLL